MLAGDSDSIELLDSQSISGNTAEKPQSKVWTHADQWWAVFADSAGTGVWRLDGTTWTKVLNLTSGAYNADVKPVGDLAHVLLEKGTSSRLVTVQYVSGVAGTYQPWSVQPNLVTVPLLSSTETATLDVDSTGRLWVAFDTTTEVRVIHSASPYTTWKRSGGLSEQHQHRRYFGDHGLAEWVDRRPLVKSDDGPLRIPPP